MLLSSPDELDEPGDQPADDGDRQLGCSGLVVLIAEERKLAVGLHDDASPPLPALGPSPSVVLRETYEQSGRLAVGIGCVADGVRRPSSRCPRMSMGGRGWRCFKEEAWLGGAVRTRDGCSRWST